MDKVLDQPQDQQHIAKLTEQQVMLRSFDIFFLFGRYIESEMQHKTDEISVLNTADFATV